MKQKAVVMLLSANMVMQICNVDKQKAAWFKKWSVVFRIVLICNNTIIHKNLNKLKKCENTTIRQKNH